MCYINENLRNWLLGMSEVDERCPSIPPPTESPEAILQLYSKTTNKIELEKLNLKLKKLGYEIKTVHVLKSLGRANL